MRDADRSGCGTPRVGRVNDRRLARPSRTPPVPPDWSEAAPPWARPAATGRSAPAIAGRGPTGTPPGLPSPRAGCLASTDRRPRSRRIRCGHHDHQLVAGDVDAAARKQPASLLDHIHLHDVGADEGVDARAFDDLPRQRVGRRELKRRWMPDASRKARDSSGASALRLAAARRECHPLATAERTRRADDPRPVPERATPISASELSVWYDFSRIKTRFRMDRL